LIQLTSAGKRFGPKLLFDELNWLVTPRDRVGLVGANGTGKSTLLKVLAGIDTLDYGSMQQMKASAPAICRRKASACRAAACSTSA